MEKLKGQTAIVTGASRGIGKAIAVMFASEGANVVVTARTEYAIDDLAGRIVQSGGSALAVTADLSIDSDLQRIADETLVKYGRIDILVNNAGIIHPRINLVDFDFELWRKVVAVNLEAVALLTALCLPSMMERNYGKVINISSIGGRKGSKGRSAYRATKAALISLTESVAAETKPYGIDVNCICPGGVDTEGYREAFRMRGKIDDPSLMAPEEIAKLAVYLASDDSSSVTGAAIDAFGGSNPLFA
ncbi:MAG: SDR family oxidoreductase [Dehalococcoidia bacterium]|jgi:NAD(P)-dependent dehydrogenase (short-subunit alcohol dehydrogenase family)